MYFEVDRITPDNYVETAEIECGMTGLFMLEENN